MKPSISRKIYWKNTILVFCLLLIAFPRGAIASSQPVELLLIPIQSNQELELFLAQGLPAFEQVTTSDGSSVIILPADPQQKDILVQQGFAPQVLGNYESQAEARPFLLYGLTKDLDLANQILPILWMEGRYALTVATPELVDQVTLLGIQRKALQLKTLSIPEEKTAVPLSLNAPEAITPSQQVYNMLAQVSQSALYTSIGDFSGEWPVLINSSPYTLSTRYTYAYTPITKATRLAWEKLTAMGLTTWYDYYLIDGLERRNVLAQQTGITQPDRVLMLVAHLDSTSPSPYTLAPGADDNASGSVALLTIANILRQYQFGCTLRYALFTGEEQGYYGSIAYAKDPDPGSIQAVLNLDMLGYNTPNTAATVELHTRYANGGDLAIAYLFRDAISAYQIPLTPQIVQDGLSFSDHSPFWDEGYPAILAIEDWDDHTPYYHTTNDQLENLNMPYYTNFTKAALATFAHMGCLIDAGLTGKVTNADNGSIIPGALVEARLDAQQTWSTYTQADGSYTLVLPSGAYTVQVSANGYTTQLLGNILINNGQMTSLNIPLNPIISPSIFYLPLVNH
jgi:hypothetical protein